MTVSELNALIKDGDDAYQMLGSLHQASEAAIHVARYMALGRSIGALKELRDTWAGHIFFFRDDTTVLCACLECSWLGIAAELSAQACPKCDAKVCDQGSAEFTARLQARGK